ncbi:MAG TPA: S41 family peptidase [Caulobacteraceae bacterium]|nr:S41 family peptidase [Caulobacteraceae bacterium]
MQFIHRLRARLTAAAALGVLIGAAAAASGAGAALPRFPQPYGDQIVFVADGNIWTVARSGGTAVRLTSAQGQDMFPRVSPDGRWIAYTEASNAGTDVWVIPATGGPARRLTFNPTTEAGTGGRHGPDNMVVTWTPDSRAVVFLTKKDQWNDWIQSMYEVPVEGGPATAMPIDTAVGLATFGPDGHTIAYNRIFRNFRTWKRYNGGLAQQVYTFDFDTKKLTQVTDWSGTNTSPMWWKDRIYYLSDRDSHRRANIWVHDNATGQDREVTHFADYDIDFPAIGADAIAFQQGGKLWVLDLPSEQLREIPLSVPDDNARTRVRAADVHGMVRLNDPAGQPDYALAPNGKRALFSARGDIFSVPSEDGATRDLTGTQGVDEDHPAWSPDGRTVAYVTDASGEQQVATRPAEGGPERVLTHFKSGYFYTPIFSPDGKQLSFSDGNHRLWLMNVAGGEPRQIAQDKLQEIHDQTFSPDGRWLAYSIATDGRRRALWLTELATGRSTQVSDGGSVDAGPVFSPDGAYLYFVSNRHENPAPSDNEFDFALLKSFGVYAIPLARETVSPMAPRSDEADTGPASDSAGVPATASGRSRAGRTGRTENLPAQGEGKPAATPTGPIAPIRIDLDGLIGRAVALPLEPANIDQMDVRGDRIYYLTKPVGLITGPLNGEKSALHYFDLKARKDVVVAQDVDSYSLSLDGQRVLIQHERSFTVADTKKEALKDSDTAKKLDLSHMRQLVDPKAEWAEMFDNAWRMERDQFFSPAMNGVDWQGVHDSYAKLLPALGSREDLNWLIGEMLGEISNSHTYVGGGDDADTGPKAHTGLLGADFALDPASGRYRIATILPGDNTREAYRSPLAQPGLNVKPGDYLLAINGVDLKAPATPDALLQLADADTTVELSISETVDGPRRRVIVTPVAAELPLREVAQITHNRELVDRLSGGRIGYVYMSDMGALGLEQFVRQFYAQLNKQALIMDDRWNGGGFIAPYALERLRRVLVAMDVGREQGTRTEPNDLVNGPKVALLNHWSASDGDIFPYFFKRYGLGPLIGTRSWGGVRGIRGEWHMMDGGYVTIPEQALYTPESQWAVENHGVDPDVEVENLPADLLAGHDVQLETAVSMLMKQLGGSPPGPPLPRPPPWLPPYPSSGIVPPKP